MDFDDGMFIDEDFGPDNVSLYSELKALPSDAKTVTRWCRPHEISQQPTLFDDGLCLGGDTLKPGAFNNNNFLGAMAAIADDDREFIYNLLISDEAEWLTSGSITWRLYLNGEWHEITIDTLLPCTDETNDKGFAIPASSTCSNSNVMWVSLLEKAYAKLSGLYSALSSGTLIDALVDLTGGSSQDILFHEERVHELTLDGLLWKRVCRYLEYGYILASSFDIGSSGVDESKSSGVSPNLAYTIQQVKYVEGLQFIQLRSAWGGLLWNGDWSGDSKQWSLHPDIEVALREEPDTPLDRSGKDGRFWMVWQDFRKYFNKVHMCRIFGEDFSQYSVDGSWAGKTAAGSVADEYIVGFEDELDEEELKYSAPKNKGFVRGTKKIDIDPRWFNNPQYRVTVSEPTNAYISLTQFGTSTNDNFALNFTVIRKKRSKHKRLWRMNAEKTVVHADENVFSTPLPRREVSKGNVEMDPRYAYIIIPYTKNAGVELDYNLRIFTNVDLQMEALEDLYTHTLSGTWAYKKGDLDNAGGALTYKGTTKKSVARMADNIRWCQNTQYRLTLPPNTPMPVEIGVVVKRTDKISKRDKESHNYIGVVATKLPELSVGNPRRKSGPRMDALGQIISSLTSTLKRNEGDSKQDFKNEYADETETSVERKLEIVPGEWLQSSHYTKMEVGSTLVKIKHLEWLERGLVLVPSLSLSGSEGNFQMEVHSSSPILIDEIPQQSYQTIASEWVDSVAGGSHLYKTFRRNQAFQLVVSEPGVVKITLSRPTRAWKKMVTRDSVGCMIGFYVSQGKKINREDPGIYDEGRTWSETAFVPMNEVSSPELYLEPLPENEYYSIVPTTYEPKKKGPFFLTVESPVEFSLKKVR